MSKKEVSFTIHVPIERWEELQTERLALAHKVSDLENKLLFFIREYCRANKVSKNEALKIYDNKCGWVNQ